MISSTDRFQYFEDDTLAQEWYNGIVNMIAWRAFQHQEEWLYMYGELGEKRYPCIKDNFYEYMGRLFDDEIGWLKEFTLDKLLEMWHDDDIDVSQKVADEYNYINGLHEGEEGYIPGTVIE